MLQKSSVHLHDHRKKKMKWKRHLEVIYSHPVYPAEQEANLGEGAWGLAQLIPGDVHPTASLSTCSRVWWWKIVVQLKFHCHGLWPLPLSCSTTSPYLGKGCSCVPWAFCPGWTSPTPQLLPPCQMLQPLFLVPFSWPTSLYVTFFPDFSVQQTFPLSINKENQLLQKSLKPRSSFQYPRKLLNW